MSKEVASDKKNRWRGRKGGGRERESRAHFIIPDVCGGGVNYLSNCAPKERHVDRVVTAEFRVSTRRVGVWFYKWGSQGNRENI